MATFITTIKFTQQGIKSIDESTKRAAALKASAKKLGVKVKDIYWTLGDHDGVLIFEADDDETATAAMLYLGSLDNLHTAIHGIDREEVLAPDWQPLVQLAKLAPLHPAIAEVAAGSYRHKQPPEIKGSGWVVQSLEAALWAFHQADSFDEAVLRAVNLGDDADTTGAVCGQFAGAYWGESGVPQRWQEGLVRRELIDKALQGIIV